ncbi:SDR family NAD(P)-dependent oxidoreductase [Allorhodopirellula heiligendammensis]|uniref:NADP-dependent 3-hydroxy acid dehydrogenase YdfG n=1 Tax=Allorhodopirellula heiligendammensis TaxID=2714739 RepID=A0A5C6BDH0_9BACT|nr:SDR family oxidoreductase [Allorhodopirellula heiligendammensis]TWU10108.1 NADP-dependent 3-hydroxy acid dehydrogenase YdfG [Allorhodopirellula heiligendammensis]
MATTLITGASSGIGRELSKQFAAGGDDIVITARSESELNNLADEVRRAWHVNAMVIVCDLAQPHAADKLHEELVTRSIEVDNLVNNAGFGALGKFAELSPDRQTEMLMLNVVSLTRLTRLLLPSMLERGHGGVLNVGSIAAYQAGPNMCVYYASKAYVLSFTEALHEELRGTGLHVTCLEPGPTSTGFGDDSGMSSLPIFQSQAMSAENVAKAGYKAYRNNTDVVIPGWKNRALQTSAGFLPRFVTRKITAKIHGS